MHAPPYAKRFKTQKNATATSWDRTAMSRLYRKTRRKIMRPPNSKLRR